MQAGGHRFDPGTLHLDSMRVCQRKRPLAGPLFGLWVRAGSDQPVRIPLNAEAMAASTAAVCVLELARVDVERDRRPSVA